jgi:hypothetical protein
MQVAVKLPPWEFQSSRERVRERRGGGVVVLVVVCVSGVGGVLRLRLL